MSSSVVTRGRDESMEGDDHLSGDRAGDRAGASPTIDLVEPMFLTEGPVFDTRMIELVQAMAGCSAGDAEYALQCTTQLEGGDPFSWCSRAVVRLKRIGLA